MWREITFNSGRMKTKRLHLRRKSTKHEDTLWNKLRNNQLGTKFKRQYSIGPYIVDFYSSDQKLVIELDGGQHQRLEEREYDDYRSRYFQSLGQTVIRIKNSELDTDLTGVLEKIKYHISPLLR